MTRYAALIALAAATYTAPAHAARVKDSVTAGGMTLQGTWEKVDGGWEATGAVSVGGVDLADAALVWSRLGNRLYGTADVELTLMEGCTLNGPDAFIGYASGATVLANQPDVPVKADEDYLAIDVDANTTLECLGVEFELAGGADAKLYINPNDPSIYVQVADLLEVEDATLGRLLKTGMNVEVSDAYVGLSARGLVPWEGNYPIDGETPALDAHVLLGGSFEIEMGQVRLGVDGGSLAVNVADETTCLSGALYIPGYAVPRTNISFDVPLGEGTACFDAEAGRLAFAGLMGGNPWSDLPIPSYLQAMANGDELEVSGHFERDTFRVELAGERKLGPWDLDATLVVTPTDFELSGGATTKVVGKTVADASMEGGTRKVPVWNGWKFIERDGVVFTMAGTMGLRGATADVEFTLVNAGEGWSLMGGAEIRLFGSRLSGNFEFDGTTFQGLTLNASVDLVVCQGTLRLALKKDGSVKVTAIGTAYVPVPVEFSVGVDTRGCFTVPVVGRVCL